MFQYKNEFKIKFYIFFRTQQIFSLKTLRRKTVLRDIFPLTDYYRIAFNAKLFIKEKIFMQIFLNYLTVFILPAVIGAAARLLFMKAQRGWIVSLVFTCLSVGAGTAVLVLPGNGNEAPGLLAISALTATVTSLIIGLILMLIRKQKNREQKS